MLSVEALSSISLVSLVRIKHHASHWSAGSAALSLSVVLEPSATRTYACSLPALPQ